MNAMNQIYSDVNSLRRYAHFMCQGDEEADFIVKTALLEINASGGLPSDYTRSTLFRVFHGIWLPVDRPGFLPRNALENLLADLSPAERAALLLCAFERFELSAAASIIGCRPYDLQVRLERACAITGLDMSARPSHMAAHAYAA